MTLREGIWRNKETGKLVQVRRVLYRDKSCLLYYVWPDEPNDTGFAVFENWKRKFEWVGLPDELRERIFG